MVVALEVDVSMEVVLQDRQQTFENVYKTLKNDWRILLCLMKMAAEEA